MQYFFKLITVQILFITCHSLDIETKTFCSYLNSDLCCLYCSTCQCKISFPTRYSSTTRTSSNEDDSNEYETSSSKSFSLSLGISFGLGLGIPFIILTIYLVYKVMYCKNKANAKRRAPVNLAQNESVNNLAIAIASDTNNSNGIEIELETAEQNNSIQDSSDLPAYSSLNANIAAATSNPNNLNHIEIEIVTDKQNTLPTYNSLFN